MRPHRPLRADDHAVASVEFAILGSVFVALIFGILSSGLLLWTKNAVDSAAAFTARCVALGSPDCTNSAQYAVAQATAWTGLPIIVSSNVTWTTRTTCHAIPGSFAVVSIASSYWASVLPPPLNSVTIHATSCYPMNAASPFS